MTPAGGYRTLEALGQGTRGLGADPGPHSEGLGPPASGDLAASTRPLAGRSRNAEGCLTGREKVEVGNEKISH